MLLHTVLVNLTSLIVILKENVSNVITDVKNVLNTLIMNVEDTVSLVLMTETTTHHSVLVHTEPLKSLVSVNHVMLKDVKPVVKTTLITVVLVKLTESKILQFVAVTMVTMKMKTKSVNLVVLNV
jgi:predicted metal-dependent enzyme (double-stranded beta helix superfamily)